MLKCVVLFCLALLTIHGWAEQPETLKTERAKMSYAIGAQIGNSFKDQDSAIDPVIFLLGVKDALASSQTLSSDRETLSYRAGTKIGNNFKACGIEIDPEIFLQGVKDSQMDSKLLLGEEELGSIMTAYRSDLRRKVNEAAKSEGEINKKASETFLAENMKNAGVVTLPSGLQYKILKTGEGKKPKATDTVVCNYRGTLLDGTEFDNSYKRNHPETFSVSEVIKGWVEALQLMPAGSKWELFIPANLAYGEDGVGRRIGPNAALIFEVELISIQDAEQEQE